MKQTVVIACKIGQGPIPIPIPYSIGQGPIQIYSNYPL